MRFDVLFIEGDDCISTMGGSKNVEDTYITCGPIHGIRNVASFLFLLLFIYMQFNYYLFCSIGSLGAGGSTDYVSNVILNRVILLGTTN
jgi:polygalacturonase